MKSITLGIGKNRRKYEVVDYPLDGSIDSPGSSKILYVGRERGKRVHLETAIHECMHGETPFSREDIVDRVSRSLARLLWGLGYRLRQEPERKGK